MPTKNVISIRELTDGTLDMYIMGAHVLCGERPTKHFTCVGETAANVVASLRRAAETLERISQPKEIDGTNKDNAT